MTALSSTTISGYVDTSAVWRMGNNTSQTGAGGANLVPGTLGNKADGFNLNVVKLTLEKPLDESEWAAGYKVDMLFGPDANFWNPGATATAQGDFSLKQAYVQLRAPVGNGIDFKMGTFDTIVGYESFEAGNNPNYTHSYGWAITPTQHTGLLASYKFCDSVSMTAGIANIAATGINSRPFRTHAGVDGIWGTADDAANIVSETEKTYMAAVALTAPDSMGFLAGSTLYAGVVDGLANTESSDVTWIYVGATMNTPVENLKAGIAFDERMTSSTDDGQGLNTGGSEHAYSIAGYLTYQASEKLKLAARVEYAKGSVDQFGLYNAATAPFSETDPKVQLGALTLTADYSLWANVITRLEFRWDRDLTSQHIGTDVPDAGGPFGFDDRNNYILALNVIYKF
jgi:hypothetical protein